MNRELIVFVDRVGGPGLCGRLWLRASPREGASFEYAPDWLARPDGFALDPELPLVRGTSHTALPLFRAFADPSPDRWGQTLLRRAERAHARREGRAPRTLMAVDFLTLVDDETRLGALRFKDASDGEGAPFLTSIGKPIPPIVDLPRLLAASDRVLTDDETDDDLALLLAPGTSLGGARPKATLRAADGSLLMAKFPRDDDEWPVTRWEATALALAEAAGIRVPTFRIEMVAKRAVLVLRRFDREGRARVPFMSAMTALSADAAEPGSYVALAEAIRRDGANVAEDLRELLRRLVLNVLISNTDDHLRNHGFLWQGTGWRLAPAYDLNPVPADVRPRVHALPVGHAGGESSMEAVFEAAASFGLSQKSARAIAREVARGVKTWRAVGGKLGLGKRDLDGMCSAFEHADLALASK